MAVGAAEVGNYVRSSFSHWVLVKHDWELNLDLSIFQNQVLYSLGYPTIPCSAFVFEGDQTSPGAKDGLDIEDVFSSGCMIVSEL